jgi:tetratricopeptide (TPR) repeat protein
MKKLFKNRAFVNIVLLACGIIITAIGTLMFSGSLISGREDIKLYNQALGIYNEEDYFEATSMSFASYPLDNLIGAIEYFQKAASVSTDNKLQSMALSNIGTAIIRDYLYFSEERSLSYGLAEAQNMLIEAIRLDPDNDYAKYNLEYLGSLMTEVAKKQAVSSLSHGGDAGTTWVQDLGY